MAKNNDILKELEKLQNPPGVVSGLNNDQRVVPAILLATRAIVRLDETSSRLAIIYIVLTVALFIEGAIQIYLMFHGR
jgi:hypothetical protein